MRTMLSTSCVIHEVHGTDRQLHRPHLTWQAVTVHSDRMVPGLFICCRRERSWGVQIALHRERQPSLLWSVCTCVLTSSVATVYARGKLKSVYGFYLLMTSLCCLSVSAGDLSSSACSYRPGSWFTAALNGAVMSWPYSTSSVTQGPCSAWLPDSCPLLQRQRMRQPYIIGQLWGGDKQSQQNQ